MRHLRLVGILAVAVCALASWTATANASFGSAQGPALPTTAPFEQCPAVFLDPSCGYLIDITNAPKPKVLVDASVGFYEGSDDVLVGVQNDSSTPVSSLHIGLAGSGDDSFGFDGDGLCQPGGAPIPGECPFGPSLADPFDYWGPDAELTAENEDAGTVTFSTPLAPGEYTYFSLESPFLGSPIVAGSVNDLLRTTLSDTETSGARIASPVPTDVTDSATLFGAHPAEEGGEIVYHLYSDPACTSEILGPKGEPAGGAHPITVEGEIPTSNPVGSKLETNHVYYWKAIYKPGTKGDEETETNCGDETMTFGTPPQAAGSVITTNLTASNGATGANVTVPQGTAVSDTAFVNSGGAAQSGRVTYYVYQDSGCTSQVQGVRLGGSSSPTGAYGPSAPVTLPLGTYYFQAIYSGNGKAAPGRSACGSEILTVAPPCTCSAIKTYMNHFSVFGAGSTRLGMRLNVALGCTTGVGGCTGEVLIHAPSGAKFIDTAKHPKGVKGFSPTATLRVACAGPCAATTIQRASLTWLALKTRHFKRGKKKVTVTEPIRSFTPKGRAKKSKVVVIETVCNTAAGPIRTRIVMTIRFDKHGQVDYKKSDLNGDGRPDGKQLKEF
jgi:hypothetical protein